MGEGREGFVFYRSFYESLSCLSKEEKADCLDALAMYALDGIEPEGVTGAVKALFLAFKPQIDANNRRYANGCKGGKPKNNQNETKTKPNTNQTITKDEPKEKDKEKVKDNDKEKEKEKNIKGSAPFSDNETLNEAFQDFQKMRKSIKKPLTDRAIGRLRNKLNNLSENPETQAAILNQSTDHCWQDVYELKDDYRQQSPRKPTQSEEFYDPDLENLTSEELAQMEADVNARRCSKSEWMNLWRRRKNGFV